MAARSIGSRPVDGATTELSHDYAGMNSGHDRYWAECSCGWVSLRLLSSDGAHAAWRTHASDASGGRLT